MRQAASWVGTPSIKGGTEAIRMALLTFSLVGLQLHAVSPPTRPDEIENLAGMDRRPVVGIDNATPGRGNHGPVYLEMGP
ncbi:hypothetical protein RJZ90_000674 [Blastomyces dermatitidis]